MRPKIPTLSSRDRDPISYYNICSFGQTDKAPDPILTYASLVLCFLWLRIALSLRSGAVLLSAYTDASRFRTCAFCLRITVKVIISLHLIANGFWCQVHMCLDIARQDEAAD